MTHTLQALTNFSFLKVYFFRARPGQLPSSYIYDVVIIHHNLLALTLSTCMFQKYSVSHLNVPRFALFPSSQVPKIISNLSRGDLGGLRGPWADGAYR